GQIHRANFVAQNPITTARFQDEIVEPRLQSVRATQRPGNVAKRIELNPWLDVTRFGRGRAEDVMAVLLCHEVEACTVREVAVPDHATVVVDRERILSRRQGDKTGRGI